MTECTAAPRHRRPSRLTEGWRAWVITELICSYCCTAAVTVAAVQGAGVDAADGWIPVVEEEVVTGEEEEEGHGAAGAARLGKPAAASDTWFAVSCASGVAALKATKCASLSVVCC